MSNKNVDLPCCNHSADRERWVPLKGHRYFLILGDGTIKTFQWHDTDFDRGAWNLGNCFRLKRDAERARDAVKQLLVHNQATFLGMTRCASCSPP
jgi:hypothetical protein